MRTAWLALLMVACNSGKSGGGAVSLFDKTKFEDFAVKFVGEDVGIDFTIRDQTGAIVQELAPISPRQFDVRFATGPQPATLEGDPPPGLCRGTFFAPDLKFDTTTKRAHVAGQMRSATSGSDYRSCKKALLEDAPKKIWISFSVGTADEELKKLDLPDDRPAKLPALDAEIDKLEAALKTVDPAKTYPPCTQEHVTTDLEGKPVIYRMDVADLRAVGNPSHPWWSLTTGIFGSILDYQARRHSAPSALLEVMQMNPRVVVYIAKTSRWPSLSGTTFTPGEYDGRAVVVDRIVGGPTCELAFHAQSSETVSYKVTQQRRGDQVKEVGNTASGEVIDDLKTNISKSVAAAFTQAGIGRAAP